MLTARACQAGRSWHFGRVLADPLYRCPPRTVRIEIDLVLTVRIAQLLYPTDGKVQDEGLWLQLAPVARSDAPGFADDVDLGFNP